MKDEKRMDENLEKMLRESLRLEALEADGEIPGEIGLATIECRKKGKTRRSIGRRLLPAAACLAALLLSGVAVNAAVGGMVIRLLRGSEDSVFYVNQDGITYTVTNNIGTLNPDGGSRCFSADDFVINEMVDPDETTLSLCMVFERNGHKYIINPGAHVSARDGATSEDLYYTIRQQLLWFFENDADWRFLKEDIIAQLREFAGEEEEDYIRDALLAVADDYEKDRKMFIVENTYFDNPGEYVCRGWFCEDMTDIPDRDKPHVLIAWVRGLPEGEEVYRFVEWTKEGGITMKDFSEELLEEYRLNGIPVYDRR